MTITEACQEAFADFLAGRLDRAESTCRIVLDAKPFTPLPHLIQAAIADSRDETRAAWTHLETGLTDDVNLTAEADEVLAKLRTGHIISYASNGEDVMLRRALADRPGGFYIDVGANHPMVDSVTALFYLRGWSGINIEPSRHIFDHLAKHRARDINLNIAVGEAEGELPFLDMPNTGLSTLAPDLIATYQPNAGCDAKPVPVRPLKDICDEHAGAEIDFLKVDVEGWEKPVLLGADWQRHRPRVVVVEATRPMTHIPAWDDWEPLLLGNDYLFAWFDGYNRYYVRAEDRHRLDAFRFPPTQSDRFVLFREAQAAFKTKLMAIQLAHVSAHPGTAHRNTDSR